VRGRRQSEVAIHFETHATTVDNERWIATGWGETRLSAAGRRQAVELGDRLAGEEIAAVLCSDLAHAADSARIAVGARGLRVLHDWRLRECDYGELAGGPIAEIEQVRTEHLYEPFPGGESYADVVARVRSCLRDLGPRFAERRVAVIGHQGTKLALDHVLEGTPLPEVVAMPFRWRPGWVYTLAVDA
jgi:2,3-bisphosphoglycerate-dependent phosphoglycerate mutase